MGDVSIECTEAKLSKALACLNLSRLLYIAVILLASKVVQ